MQTRMGPAGLFVLTAIFVFVVIGSILLPYDFYMVPQPDEIKFVGRPPAWGRPFGETGMLQLDVMTLVANGGRTSLTIGFATAIGSITIGTFVGVIAGFLGGKVDSFLMRLADVFLMIPSLFVILFLARIFRVKVAAAPCRSSSSLLPSAGWGLRAWFAVKCWRFARWSTLKRRARSAFDRSALRSDTSSRTPSALSL